MNKKEKINLSRDIIIISGVFCAFTALLLLINYMQMARYEPLENEALKTLVERLSSDPNNEALKQDIRNLDLLARKAYFTTQWQVKTGAWLLLSGSIVLAIAIWFYMKLRSGIEKPVFPDQSELPARLITQKWLLFSVGSFMILALLASFLSRDYLNMYESNEQAGSEPEEQTVEVITVSKSEIPDIPESPDSVTTIAINSTPDETAITGEALVPEKKIPVKLSFEELKKQHNSFRGAFGHGISYMKNIPVDWDSNGKNVKWKTPVPVSGFNSPVIWDDKIFLSGANEKIRVVYCFNRITGKLLWEREVSKPGSPVSLPDVTDDTGLAAPTLTVDGNAVYAIFGTGELVAYDMEGNPLWAKNLGVPDNHYGHSSSLLVWNNKLIIQYDTNKRGRLLALNTTNGESVWDVKRTSRISWASPILISMNNKYQVATTADPSVAAHDIETGAVLWSLDCMMGEVGPSLAFSEGVVFAANEYARLVAIKPGEKPAILWEDNEYLPEASSPVVHNGLLFLATSYGMIACYDAKSGEKLWEHEAGKGFYSSPMVVDGKVYVIDLGGVMYIFKESREKAITGTPALGENAYATPAFTDGMIYIRGEKNLFCIGN